MLNRKVTLKILLFLIFTDILETFAQYCFKKTVIPQSDFIIQNFSDVFLFIKSVSLSPYLWVAFLSVFAVFVLWSTILSKIDLSVAVPIASFSYILVPLVSIFFLHEEVTFLDWTGITFILLGVIFVSMSSHKDEAPAK